MAETTDCYNCGENTAVLESNQTACCGLVYLCQECAAELPRNGRDNHLTCFCGNYILTMAPVDSLWHDPVSLSDVFNLHNAISADLIKLTTLVSTLPTLIQPPFDSRGHDWLDIRQNVIENLRKYNHRHGLDLTMAETEARADVLLAEYQTKQTVLVKNWRLDLEKVLSYQQLYQRADQRYRTITAQPLSQVATSLQQWYGTYWAKLPHEDIARLYSYFTGQLVSYRIVFYHEIGIVGLDQVGQVQLQCDNELQVEQARQLLGLDREADLDYVSLVGENTDFIMSQVKNYRNGRLHGRSNTFFSNGDVVDIFYDQGSVTTQYYSTKGLVKVLVEPEALMEYTPNRAVTVNVEIELLLTSWLSPNTKGGFGRFGRNDRYLSYQINDDEGWETESEQYMRGFHIGTYLLVQKLSHDSGQDSSQGGDNDGDNDKAKVKMSTLYQNTDTILLLEKCYFGFDQEKELFYRKYDQGW